MKGVEWMAKNPVAANILLLVIVLGGGFTATTIKQEVFPDIALDIIEVSVVYPGAGASETASALCLPMEEAVSNQEEIERLTCQAQEGSAQLILELTEGSDVNFVLQEVRNQITAINQFPADAETPIISRAQRRREIMAVILFGPVPETLLFDLGRRLKEEMALVEGVSQVDISGHRNKELVIEVKSEDLNRFGLNLSSLSQIISQASLDLPAGSVKTERGEILLRSISKRQEVEEFGVIAVQTAKDGARVELGDIAKIEERLQQKRNFVRFDGQPAIYFHLYQSDRVTPAEVSKNIKEYLTQRQSSLPESLHLTLWNDRSDVFVDRFQLLIKNAAMGLVLVFVILAMFMEIHLAFWVMLGIPVSFLGSLALLPYTGITINMMSLFAFILVLGIVVDDAIVIGEKVFQNLEAGMPRQQAAIQGCYEMGGPVIYSVLTTLVAFAPLMYIEGRMGKFMVAIPVIVMAVLVVSLVEALFVLPSHLARPVKISTNPIMVKLEHYREKAEVWLNQIIEGPYKKNLNWALHNRHSTVALALATLMVCVGLVMGGVLKMQFFPKIESDEVSLTAELPPGYPADKAQLVLETLEEVGKRELAKIDQEKGKGLTSFDHAYSTYRDQGGGGSPNAQAEVKLRLKEKRSISTFEFAARWRKAVGPMPEVLSLALSGRGMDFGADIQLSLSHEDPEVLNQAVTEAKTHLVGFVGVKEVEDSQKEGKRELRYHLSPAARSLGITPQAFAQALRGAFFGTEVLRLQKDKQEISVYLRLGESEKDQLASLQNLRISSPGGGEITLAEAAYQVEAQEPAAIVRINRQPVIDVTAKIEDSVKDPDQITNSLKQDFVPVLIQHHPGLLVNMEGADKERKRSADSLWMGFIMALVLIYAILAIFFRSYLQPAMVMSAIPFGIAGAVFGHLILGHPLSFMSLFGLVGLSGVVVNDALILVEAINLHPKLSSDPFAAIIEAAQSRVRPIIMTSLTTFLGLMPILAETSRQAQFLIPMAISLGVGIMFATFITLILLPCFYLSQLETQAKIRAFWAK